MNAAGSLEFVFAATTAWDARPLTEHHLARALARGGHRVLFAEPPARVRPRAVRPRPARRDGGVDVVTPVSLPYRDRWLGWPLSRPLVARQVRSAARRAGLRAPVLVTFATHRDLGGHLGERTRVAYLKDAAGASAGLIGLPRAAGRLERAARRAAAGAQLVVTPSPLLAREFAGVTAAPILELGPGCDAMPWDGRLHPAVTGLPWPRAGVVGTLNDRIDWSLLGRLARAWPQLTIVLAGPRSRIADPAFGDVVGLPNVIEIGPVAHDDVAPLLAGLDAGLIPYRLSPFNVRSTPLKAVEYAAAGLPVVGTAVPALGTTVPCTAVACSDGFAHALRGVLETDSASRRAARRRDATARDWEDRAARFAAAVAEATG